MLSCNFITLALAPFAAAFPTYASLAGLPREELDKAVATLDYSPPGPPPGPLEFNGTKLIHDAEHPWEPLREGDIRGPCPGLNALANHGYLPRNGIATPSHIVGAVQEGFNMEHDLTKLVTYAAHLVDGNVVTDLLSIGGKTPLTGPDPPAPAIVGGLSTHSVFEGDASTTRADAYFGDNHSFNETLWEQFVSFSNKYGAGRYNITVAAEFRHQRIQDSIATNPEFSFVSPRYFTAFAESVFPINFFIDGRKEDGQLDLDVALGFFRDGRLPEDFHRASKPSGTLALGEVYAAHPIQPGSNVGGVNNYVVDPTSADFDTPCLLYENFVMRTIAGLYPNPTGVLREALNINLVYLYEGFGGGCTQVFPYGKDE